MNASFSRRAKRTGCALLVVALSGGASLAARPGKRKPPPPLPAAQTPAEPSQPAAAQATAPPPATVAVTVVEVQGIQAYLTPGAARGVRRGAKVTLGKKEYRVVQATDTFAAIVVAEDPPRENDKGFAVPVTEESSHVVTLPKPRPLETWARVWPEPVPPALTQHPRFVPLGDVERDRRWDVRLTASGGGLLPLGARGSNLARAELEARVHAAPFDAPAALDVDVSLQRWFDARLSSRDGASARPLVYVRELFASYGASGFFGGVGRMRYAASTLGALDGARASAPVGAGFTIGAFGGFLPEPLGGAPSTAGNRFGVEAAYSRPDLALRPDAALVLHGSTFAGRVDERRVSFAGGLYPGPARLGAYFEVSGFDRNNPWKASTVELTAAGIDSWVRFGRFRLEGRFDVRQPERSRWLAAYLPVSWFCTAVPAAGSPPAPEPCAGSTSTAAYGTVDAAVDLDRVLLSAGVTTIGDLTQSGAPNATTVFAAGRVLRIADILRFDASGNYSKGTYVDGVGGGFGPGVALLDEALDLSAYYRVASLKYRSTPASLIQHTAGGAVVYLPDATLLFAVQGEAVMGDDTRALILFGTATWRPRL